jgi:hypothetical protein
MGVGRVVRWKKKERVFDYSSWVELPIFQWYEIREDQYRQEGID